ncbi:LysR family transcriptional regulator [Niveibacterium sp. SC-1]|uniref:LysR family transcriptional regulator n=1 Tax=Niveibacterium sp. SC-1 TaxID=3135646 RepID=UPI00311D2E26
MSNLSRVNLNRLEVFVAVVEAGSITAAAARLGLAKTMVSAHVQRLEAELGASLLIRTTRRLSLTETGETFFESARAIVADAQAAIEAASHQNRAAQGTLRVTAPIDFSAAVLAPVAVRLGETHPGLHIELLSGDRLFDLVAEGIDLAIRAGQLRDSSLQATRLGDFTECLVATPAFLAQRALPAEPAALADWPFVALSVLPQPLRWRFTHATGEEQEIVFASRFSANTAHAVRASVLADAGLALLPDFAVKGDIAQGRLLRLLPEWQLPRGGIHAVFPASRHRPHRVRLLVDALRARLEAQD